MAVSDPHEALATIVSTEQRIRRAIARQMMAPHLVTWGLIWLVGYTAQVVLPAELSSLLWLALVAVGCLVSFVVPWRSARQLRSPLNRRLGLSWMAAALYLALWSSLLFPRDPSLASFVLVTGIMAGYLLMGIWLQRLFGLVGALVTVLALAGYVLGPTAFAILVGLCGGLLLVLAGIWLWWKI